MMSSQLAAWFFLVSLARPQRHVLGEISTCFELAFDSQFAGRRVCANLGGEGASCTMQQSRRTISGLLC